MQAINQAAGILHKNISSTFRRCHGPQFPIIVKMAFGGGDWDWDGDGIGVNGDGLVNDSIVEIPFIVTRVYTEVNSPNAEKDTPTNSCLTISGLEGSCIGEQVNTG